MVTNYTIGLLEIVCFNYYMITTVLEYKKTNDAKILRFLSKIEHFPIGLVILFPSKPKQA